MAEAEAAAGADKAAPVAAACHVFLLPRTSIPVKRKSGGRREKGVDGIFIHEGQNNHTTINVYIHSYVNTYNVQRPQHLRARLVPARGPPTSS